MSKTKLFSIFAAVFLTAGSVVYLVQKRKCKEKKQEQDCDRASLSLTRIRDAKRHFRTLSPREVFQIATERGLCKNSIVERHALPSCHALVKNHLSSDKQRPPPPLALPAGCFATCYGCGDLTSQLHSLYIFSCVKCGSLFCRMLSLQRNLGNQTALVVGGRTKLGHQVALKLLRAGATVIITTRFPDDARRLFEKYEHYNSFSSRLLFAPALDLRAKSEQSLTDRLKHLVEFVRNECEAQRGALNILVNCAAQTIACRESQSVEQRANSVQKNRYNYALFVASDQQNSWSMRFEEVSEQELRDVHDVNAIGIALLVQAMLPLMRKSRREPYIVNVHAREGLFQTHKSAKHFHTNMAKAALHMLTRMLCEQRLKTENDKEFRVHGVDPGWFSVDEYYENGAPMPCAPLDEVDAAARVCYPIFKQLRSNGSTRRHFVQTAI